MFSKVKSLLQGRTAAIAEVCAALEHDGLPKAVAALRDRYPFVPEGITQRHYGPFESTRVFVRDGFIDRYSGARLVFPPVLRALSFLMPVEFPYHPNWRTDVTHSAYWQVAATIDHLVPVTLGGVDAEPNWVTTSMSLNSAKMNWTLEELGWTLHPPGSFAEWDGLLGWFLEQAKRTPEIVRRGSLRRWHVAARAAISAPDPGGG